MAQTITIRGFPAELGRRSDASRPLHPVRSGIGYRAASGLSTPLADVQTPAAPSPLVSRSASHEAVVIQAARSLGPSSSLMSSAAPVARNRLGALIDAASAKLSALLAPPAPSGVRIRPPAGCGCR